MVTFLAMPCPPDPRELRYDNIKGSLSRLRERLEKAWKRLQRMHAAATRHLPIDDSEAELQVALSTMQELQKAEYPGPSMVADDCREENFALGDAEVDWLKRAIARSEVAACILGCALYRTVKDGSEEKVLAAHRRHREKEHAAQLRTVRRDLATYRAAERLRTREDKRIAAARKRVEERSMERDEVYGKEDAFAQVERSRRSVSTAGLSTNSAGHAEARLKWLQALEPPRLYGERLSLFKSSP
jgi:hypothetical protein